MTSVSSPSFRATKGTYLSRLFGWIMLAILAAYVLNNFLSVSFDLSPAGLTDAGAILLTGVYLAGIVIAVIHVNRSPDTSLRSDSGRISNINVFLIRTAFWAVFIIGVVDMALSFLRVEDLLIGLMGQSLADSLGKAQFRGTYVHMPLLGVSILIACFTRTLGFHWLALMVVVAELLIVIMRFVFSYEQSFMADLVRFWYGALFLFASAHTLLEEGHVRVDVLYAGMKDRSKAVVNAVGTVCLGMSFCWVILIMGMSGKRSVINSPVLSFEVSQAGFGMYIKYLMAAFLGVFAVSMIVQFVSYFLAAIADYRGDPDKYVPDGPAAH